MSTPNNTSNSHTPHVVSAYEGELRTLEVAVRDLAATASQQLEAAIDALIRMDLDKAQAVIERDREIDELDDMVEAACVRILALRQPHADDLRLTIATIKVANELERVGDFAKNIAKRVQAVSRFAALPAVTSIPHLKDLAVDAVTQSATAFLSRDAELAKRVWGSDEPLDAAYTALFRETMTYMLEDPGTITPATHLLFAAKNLERVGDHATNIAELAYFLATGKRLTGERPKADQTPFAAPGADVNG